MIYFEYNNFDELADNLTVITEKDAQKQKLPVIPEKDDLFRSWDSSTSRKN